MKHDYETMEYNSTEVCYNISRFNITNPKKVKFYIPVLMPFIPRGKPKEIDKNISDSHLLNKDKNFNLSGSIAFLNYIEIEVPKHVTAQIENLKLIHFRRNIKILEKGPEEAEELIKKKNEKLMKENEELIKNIFDSFETINKNIEKENEAIEFPPPPTDGENENGDTQPTEGEEEAQLTDDNTSEEEEEAEIIPTSMVDNMHLFDENNDMELDESGLPPIIPTVPSWKPNPNGSGYIPYIPPKDLSVLDILENQKRKLKFPIYPRCTSIKYRVLNKVRTRKVYFTPNKKNIALEGLEFLICFIGGNIFEPRIFSLGNIPKDIEGSKKENGIIDLDSDIEYDKIKGIPGLDVLGINGEAIKKIEEEGKNAFKDFQMIPGDIPNVETTNNQNNENTETEESGGDE